MNVPEAQTESPEGCCSLDESALMSIRWDTGNLHKVLDSLGLSPCPLSRTKRRGHHRAGMTLGQFLLQTMPYEESVR